MNSWSTFAAPGSFLAENFDGIKCNGKRMEVGSVQMPFDLNSCEKTVCWSKTLLKFLRFFFIRKLYQVGLK